MTDMGFKYNAMRIPVTPEFVADSQAFSEALEDEMDRVWSSLSWSLADDVANGHLGPRLRPGPGQLHEARENLRRWAKFDRWKRSAGRYMRAAGTPR